MTTKQIANRRWYLANRARLLEKARTPEVKARCRAWRVKNAERVSQYNREYGRLNRTRLSAHKKYRMNTDPEFRLKEYLRNRIRDALKNNRKSCLTMELLGMSIPEFKTHIQNKFRPGMTWENYGSVWHLDHIRPCARFDLLDPEQQKICFRWDNIQPLFARENMRKGDTCAD